MVCSGNNKLLCGGPNRLQMYYSNDTTKLSADPSIPKSSGNYTFFNCVVDGANPRPLSTVQANDNMTVEACLKMADAGGYKFAGLEYARECWMGNTIAGQPANASLTDCNMICKGSVGELCGAGSRLAMYTRNPGV
jgi:hypothetical protein